MNRDETKLGTGTMNQCPPQTSHVRHNTSHCLPVGHMKSGISRERASS